MVAALLPGAPVLAAQALPLAGEAEPAAEEAAPATIETMAGTLHDIFTAYMAEAHVPGMVYGVVQDGKLVLVEGLGTRDLVSRTPVDADTRFRIASMSKAFTGLAILKLRDEGKLRLADPVSQYVPEVADWALPTSDSRAVTVADLMHHTAGFVEDNPWGDRQQSIAPEAFGAMMRAGMPFASSPGTGPEYSNYGFALLGRIINNASGKRYQDYIREEIMLPLGMTSTGYDVLADPPGSRAIGYRWQDGQWVREPDMPDGEFGAMGGVETTANDYAKWLAFVLSAWPASDAPETGPVRRATVREIPMLVSPWGTITTPPDAEGATCTESQGYSAGWFVSDGCEVGRNMRHTGGYPGYGSTVHLLPDAGVALFAFSARTYSSGRSVAYGALRELRRAGAIPDRAPGPPSALLEQAYVSAKVAWQAGDPELVPLAVNIALDNALDRRRAAIAALKEKVGACDTSAPVAPVNKLQGTFTWTCEKGAVRGQVQLAPTAAFELQRLDFAEFLPEG
ncbi:serine hydrolase domain-containing protein [Novosphingobium sp. PC22D]|uniref:serine hydrolase domain-containing protein n=1 Tax=Novosphingobium sp. PC22D TaxID=1962403 RepID=UPI001145769A|nr:serine hydrolase domain-containing protein [Novosphingobium sp. PC22D]